MLDPASRDVIGCVYIYPLRNTDNDACALSWVRESHAHLDTPLWHAVTEWLESDWLFAERGVRAARVGVSVQLGRPGTFANARAGDLHYPPTARVGRLTRKVAQLEAACSRYRAIGHAPSLVFEITVSVTRARGSCTDRNETPASYPSRRTASFDAWSQKPSP